jgi:hypothetical protein
MPLQQALKEAYKGLAIVSFDGAAEDLASADIEACQQVNDTVAFVFVVDLAGFPAFHGHLGAHSFQGLNIRLLVYAEH